MQYCEMEMRQLMPYSLLLLGHERAFCQDKARVNTMLSKSGVKAMLACTHPRLCRMDYTLCCETCKKKKETLTKAMTAYDVHLIQCARA